MIDCKTLNTILGNKIGWKIRVTTDKNILEGTLNYIDIHGNLLLENKERHTCFVQRSWIISIEVLDKGEQL